METHQAYGLWLAVIFNTLVFVIFAFSFAKPRTSRDWRSLGGFSAFMVALFTEMYGFPLTIYLLSGWLSRLYPETDFFSHNAGHLWHTIFRLSGDPHFDPFHIASFLLIGGGMVLLIASWVVLHRAQRTGTLAQSGPYSWIRHPQYVAFIAIMFGFLLQWPTLPTLVMFPLLALMYVRLARSEEKDARTQFGAAYDRYAAIVPGFFPRPGRHSAKLT